MSEKDILKEYGQVLLEASYIVDNPPPVISVTPKIDIALGGGVPEGCLFIMTGPEKIGKTVHALQFCKNAQQVKLENDENRKVYYGNIEGRLKKRDLEGIRGLDFSEDMLKIVGSTKGNILSGEKYLAIFDNIIHNEPHAVCVIDSFSALAAESELVGDITDHQVAAMNRYLSKFTRRFANVLPINRVTLVGITHLMANIQKFGAGKSKIEKSGNALKYAQDVKLWATHKEPLKQGETQIGQKVHWIVENSAIGAPGQKVTSIIKYGHGIWNEYELAELAKDFGIVEGKTWMTLPNGEKVQGMSNFATYLEENQTYYEELRQQVFEMIGMV
jgi:recombination protein RecA|tara:strand:- start:22546 stop:23538 length:993 start_codon:yes stop_codon:yes gene_type:complete